MNTAFKISPESFVHKNEGNIKESYDFIGEPLGKGGFGEVRKAIQIKTGLVKAIKIIKKKEMKKDEMARLINEVNILKTIVSLS